MFHIGDEGQHFADTPMIRIAQRIRIDGDDVGFDRRVETVEDIVKTPGLAEVTNARLRL